MTWIAHGALDPAKETRSQPRAGDSTPAALTRSNDLSTPDSSRTTSRAPTTQHMPDETYIHLGPASRSAAWRRRWFPIAETAAEAPAATSPSGERLPTTNVCRSHSACCPEELQRQTWQRRSPSRCPTLASSTSMTSLLSFELRWRTPKPGDEALKRISASPSALWANGTRRDARQRRASTLVGRAVSTAPRG